MSESHWAIITSFTIFYSCRALLLHLIYEMQKIGRKGVFIITLRNLELPSDILLRKTSKVLKPIE